MATQRTYRRYTNREIERVLQSIQNGGTVTGAAAHYGIPYATVIHWCRRAGVRTDLQVKARVRDGKIAREARQKEQRARVRTRRKQSAKNDMERRRKRDYKQERIDAARNA